MTVNRNKVDIWKSDVMKSVDFYNDWFMNFAPKAFRETRIKTTEQVENALKCTDNLTNICSEILKQKPEILPILRMTTCPPIARDRLIGLAGISSNLVKCMEVEKRIPPRMQVSSLDKDLMKIGQIIEKMIDPDIFIWKVRKDKGSPEEIYRASTIVADRLCGAVADPIIRNAQEKRQLLSIKNWLEIRGYQELKSDKIKDFRQMKPGTFSFRLIVSVAISDAGSVNIPVDAVIMPLNAKSGDFPILMEAKSAGDFTNTS